VLLLLLLYYCRYSVRVLSQQLPDSGDSDAAAVLAQPYVISSIGMPATSQERAEYSGEGSTAHVTASLLQVCTCSI
jgi:hypothetical protein